MSKNQKKVDAASEQRCISWVLQASSTLDLFTYSFFLQSCGCVWMNVLPYVVFRIHLRPFLNISSPAGLGPLSQCLFNVHLLGRPCVWVWIAVKQEELEKQQHMPAIGWREPGLFHLAGYDWRALCPLVELVAITHANKANGHTKRHWRKLRAHKSPLLYTQPVGY